MIENLGLDGMLVPSFLFRDQLTSAHALAICSDLDFEYPANTAQGSGFASLVTSLRTAFDQLASKKGDSTPYQITVSLSPKKQENLLADALM